MGIYCIVCHTLLNLALKITYFYNEYEKQYDLDNSHVDISCFQKHERERNFFSLFASTEIKVCVRVCLKMLITKAPKPVKRRVFCPTSKC